jgi:alpha-tubulin suppressor-like RCC1 family protein
LGSSGSAKATVANGANGQSGSPSPPLFAGQVGSGSFQTPTVAGDFDGGLNVAHGSARNPVTVTPAFSPKLNLVAWGDRISRQGIAKASLPDGLSIVVSGARHGLAVDAAGGIHAWGRNSSKETEIPSGLSNVVAVAAGSRHSLAVTQDGRVVAWGKNWSGQTEVPLSATNVVMVGAGEAHSVCLRGDGTLVAWGDNESEQLDVPILADDIVAVDCGYFHTLALRSDGNVVSWGVNLNGQSQDSTRRMAYQLDETVPSEATNVVSISAGWAHNLALRADGSVVAWGDNSHGQTTLPPSVTNVLAVEAGFYHSMALKADGSVVVWGRDVFGVVQGAGEVHGAVGISAGEDCAIANLQRRVVMGVPCSQVRTTFGGIAVLSVPMSCPPGATFQWIRDGRVIEGATRRGLVLRDCGPDDSGSYAIKVTDGASVHESRSIQVVVSATASTKVRGGGWGDNRLGQCNLPTDLGAAIAIDAGGFHGLALTPDGRVLGWGKNRDGQASPPRDLTNAVAISAGGDHSLALTDRGRVVAWGRNWEGQVNVPDSASDVVEISAGWAHSLALTRDGIVLAWGNNEYGQTEVPAGLRDVVSIEAGYYHSLAVRSDGSVVAWGETDSPPADLPPLVDVAAGWSHSLGLTENGRVLAWGGNDYGETNVPLNATNVVSVSAGFGFSLGLTAEGKVLAWGKRWYGETDVPAKLPGVNRISAGEDFVVALVEQGPPRVIRQPFSTKALQGGVARLKVEASGSLPISYQWLRGGRIIEGQTNSTLFIADVSAVDSLPNSVILRNRLGENTSESLSLQIMQDAETLPRMSFLSDRVDSEGGFVVEVRAPAGLELTLETTPDFAEWQQIERFRAAGHLSPVRLRLLSPDGGFTRFWRIR